MTQSARAESTRRAADALTVHRIEVQSRDRNDPKARAALAALRQSAERSSEIEQPTAVTVRQVYLIEGSLDPAQLDRIATELLADPVLETAQIGASAPAADALAEVHPLPGVMDPDAEAVEAAIRAMLNVEIRVQTARRYDVVGMSTDALQQAVLRSLANPVIHAVHTQPYHPAELPHGEPYELTIHDVALIDLDDAALQKLSRDAHLFLSLPEMQAIQTYYKDLGREPREIELETLAQTWSEHCVHKTLKSTVRYREESASQSAQISFHNRPHHETHADGSVTIHNLLKATVAAATNELIADGIDWCLSVFVDNAGVIRFDDNHAVCFKVETHNHPSAIEPYGGAATGIGGCIRDIIGTGLAAKPIAATDVFCVAFSDIESVPTGCLHPKRILQQVVAGVRDYGNRMGIPTLNGAVWFDNRYVGNPLVYCGCVGVMPADRVTGEPQSGDHIIALGGRTGRDGIHGATFSSAELTDTHADEFSHAVQIGNPVTEKKVLDAILEARDTDDCLFNAITDCGAGGFSSAVGEMGEHLGATVHLDRAPLKYIGLTPTEIWISEAQERMVLAVPADNIAALKNICAKHDVELCDLGEFGTEPDEHGHRQLILNYEGVEVGRLSVDFLHNGLPQTQREAVWSPPARETKPVTRQPSVDEALLALLAHPNIASKHWIIRQYDHEVQGNAVISPLVGRTQHGPSDAAVIKPVADSSQALAIANGLSTGFAADPYVMTLNAIDECVRNLVCTGADPSRIAILDNFCWPGCDAPQRMGALVRAAEACYDGAKAYRTPFISGKDSLNNQFTTESGETIRIPPTLLISGFGIVPDERNVVTMDAKRAGNAIVIVGEDSTALGGSHYEMVFGGGSALPVADLKTGPATARIIHNLIRNNLVQAAHDVSDGGLLVAIAEMCIGGGLGAKITATLDTAALFSEAPSRYVLEVQQDDLGQLQQIIGDAARCQVLGEFTDTPQLQIADTTIALTDLERAWRETLDW